MPTRRAAESFLEGVCTTKNGRCGGSVASIGSGSTQWHSGRFCLQLLQMFDALSLWFCCAVRIEPETIAVPQGPTVIFRPIGPDAAWLTHPGRSIIAYLTLAAPAAIDPRPIRMERLSADVFQKAYPAAVSCCFGAGTRSDRLGEKVFDGSVPSPITRWGFCLSPVLAASPGILALRPLHLLPRSSSIQNFATWSEQCNLLPLQLCRQLGLPPSWRCWVSCATQAQQADERIRKGPGGRRVGNQR